MVFFFSVRGEGNCEIKSEFRKKVSGNFLDYEER